MNINIYGSTGTIGRKTLKLIDQNFPKLKVNLLCAKSNLKLLTKQIIQYKPKYAFLYDSEKILSCFYKLRRADELVAFLSLKSSAC